MFISNWSRHFKFLLLLIFFMTILPLVDGQDFPDFRRETSSEYDSEDEELPSYSDDEDDPPPPPPVVPPVAPRPAIKLEEKTIMIGRIPYLSLKEMMSQARPLLSRLKKETGAKEVRLVTAKNYAGVLEALSRDTIDFAWVGPTAFVLNREKDKLMPIAKAKHLSEISYRGVFITRTDSGILGLDDVRKKTIGFVDPESASGYLYPLYVLQRLKIDPHKVCARVVFLKKHDAVLQAVLDRKIDVGVCLEATLDRVPGKMIRNQLLILGKTDEVPSDVIICRQDCPVNLRERFQEALLKITVTTGSEMGASGSAHLPTFEPATDDEFDSVQTVLQAVGPLIRQP